MLERIINYITHVITLMIRPEPTGPAMDYFTPYVNTYVKVEPIVTNVVCLIVSIIGALIIYYIVAKVVDYILRKKGWI